MKLLFALSDWAVDGLDHLLSRWEQRILDRRHADDNEVLSEPVFPRCLP